jgi:hypothetical protein
MWGMSTQEGNKKVTDIANEMRGKIATQLEIKSEVSKRLENLANDKKFAEAKQEIICEKVTEYITHSFI